MKIAQDPDPALYAVARPVAADECKDVNKRALKVLKFLQRTDIGFGLSANQLGDDRSWFAAQLFKVCINPEVLEMGDETETLSEGSLSKPGKTWPVKRPVVIRARWTTGKGKLIERQLRGFPARLFQHLCDNLNGVNVWDTNARSKKGEAV